MRKSGAQGFVLNFESTCLMKIRNMFTYLTLRCLSTDFCFTACTAYPSITSLSGVSTVFPSYACTLTALASNLFYLRWATAVRVLELSGVRDQVSVDLDGVSGWLSGFAVSTTLENQRIRLALGGLRGCPLKNQAAKGFFFIRERCRCRFIAVKIQIRL